MRITLCLCDVSRTRFMLWKVSRLQEGGQCVCISLRSDAQAMGPRRKASKLQPVGSSSGGELILRPSEPKDYINELSHEVLCHIFRYAYLQLYHSASIHSGIYSRAGWGSTVCFISQHSCTLGDISQLKQSNTVQYVHFVFIQRVDQIQYCVEAVLFTDIHHCLVLQVPSHEGHHVYGMSVQKASRSCYSVPASSQGSGSMCWSLVGVYAFR